MILTREDEKSKTKQNKGGLEGRLYSPIIFGNFGTAVF